jgi:hypothetical protein
MEARQSKYTIKVEEKDAGKENLNNSAPGNTCPKEKKINIKQKRQKRTCTKSF